MKLGKLIEKGMKFADDHQREIMLGSAIAGVVVTTVLSWRAGIKADTVLKEQKQKMDDLNEKYDNDESMEDEELDEKKRDIAIETIKRMTPIVAPPALAATSTVIAVICGYKSASTQIATLSALYSMSEKALSDQLEKTKEVVGPKKAQEITDAVSADKVKKNPPVKDTIVNTGKGSTLCYDEMSGRYFYSNPEDIRKACNLINKRMMDEYYISLNELYDELGLPDIILGEDIGFNIDDGLIDIDHLFSATLHTDDTPVLVLNYQVSTAYLEHKGRLIR